LPGLEGSLDMKYVSAVVLGLMVLALAWAYWDDLSKWERDNLMAGCLFLLIVLVVTFCIVGWFILVG
jgi:hypothetical protein